MKFLVAMVNHPIRDSFFTPAVVNELNKCGDVTFSAMSPSNKGVLRHEIQNADVVFTGWGSPCITKDILSQAPKLKIHAHTGGSVANYVSKAEYQRGIRILSGNDLYAQSVAEGCLCYTLSALRRTYTYTKTIKDGGYLPMPHFNQGLIGKKVALIGYGSVAAYYANLLQGLHVDLCVVSEHIQEEECQRIHASCVSLETAFSQCDVISIHWALTEKTQGRITGDLLKLIKPGALLVNTARAALIEEESLYCELQTGRFNAVLDVFHTEPLPTDSPLRSMPNVWLMPHVAGPTIDLREKIVLQLLDDINALQRGEACCNEISFAQAQRMTNL